MTPDGRTWLTSKKIGFYMIAKFIDEFKGEPWFDGGIAWKIAINVVTEQATITQGEPFPPGCMMATPQIKQRFIEAMRAGIEATGYIREFKWSRTFEKLKDAALRGELDGVSHAAARRMAFIFTEEYLDMVDEDAEPIL